MTQDEITNDAEVELQDSETETVEETVAEETVESTDTTEPNERLTYEQKLARATTPEEKFAIADAEANKNRRLLKKKSEKPQPQKATVQKEPSTQATNATVEETVLRAQGMDDSLLDELKTIAKVRNTSLIKAKEDPIFKAIVSQKEAEEKKAKASLGASRGSGKVEAKKDTRTPGLSKEEHKRLVLERLNK